jgi:hypothetical protein
MRLAALDRDFWHLLSGEEAHQRSPATFWIPDRDERTNLQRGQAAKLIFEIEGEGDDGEVELIGERMWVLVTERVGDLYIGILDNDCVLEPADDVYLCRGAEIPFGAEHIIDVGDPPEEYWQPKLAKHPARTWSRE